MTRQRQRQGGNDQKLNIILGMQIVILLILIISIAMIQETPNVEIVGQLIGSGPDSDGDGFSDLHEQYLGTNPNSACPSTSTPNDEAMDAWPPDFNDDRQVTLTDLTSFLAPVRHLSTLEGQPAFSYRWDLIADGRIWVQDMTTLLAPVRYYGTSCGPPTGGTTLPSCTGNIYWSLAPEKIASGTPTSLTPYASGLSNCNGKLVVFRSGLSCTGDIVSRCVYQSGCVGSAFTSPTALGEYYYTACIDKNGDGDTSDILEGEQAVIYRPLKVGPDLMPDWTQVTGALVAGNTVTLGGLINNTGAETTGSSSVAQFKFDGVAIASTKVPTLPALDWRDFSTSWIVTSTPGLHTLTLCVDVFNQVAEARETNNCANVTAPFTIP